VRKPPDEDCREGQGHPMTKPVENLRTYLTMLVHQKPALVRPDLLERTLTRIGREHATTAQIVECLHDWGCPVVRSTKRGPVFQIDQGNLSPGDIAKTRVRRPQTQE
jgi:hypothetical protein